MKRAKTIDEIYEEVRDFDLVLTADAALATALNARIDRPVVGFFAVTPKQVAELEAVNVIGDPVMRELNVIRTVSELSGTSFKFVHGEIENIKDIRRYTFQVRENLHTGKAREIYDLYESMPTQMAVMSRFDADSSPFFRGKKVAVIGVDFFNSLDKNLNSPDFHEVDLFKRGESFDIERIHQVGNDRQIANNVVDLIDPHNPNDYAIVLSLGSPITDAVRSALYRKGIPFVNSLNVKDLTQIRDYIQLLQLSMSFRTIRVRHVRELLSNYNVQIRSRSEDYLFCDLSPDAFSERGLQFFRMMSDIRESTFLDVANLVGNPGLPQIKLLLSDMGLSNQKVTSRGVNELAYAVNYVSDLRHNQEVPDNEREGVLVTDCNNSVYIDRPIVFYLGLGQDWNMPVRSKPYIDQEQESDNNALRLQVLLQQGSTRMYFVNVTKNGLPARPSSMFDVIYEREMATFDDLCDDVIRGRWVPEQVPERISRGSSGLEETGIGRHPFSKSSFNTYYRCPRAYMFSCLVSTPDQKHTEFGNLIHEFAEMYFCHRDSVRERGLDEFIDRTFDRYTGLSSPLLIDMDRGRIRRAMSNIMAYIDRYAPESPVLDRKLDDTHRNRIMSASGEEMTSTMCETDHSAPGYPMHGKYDLSYGNGITDYKTGRQKELKAIARSMILDPRNDDPEFQPIFYLAIAMLEGRGITSFNQFYAMGNDVRSMDPNFDISENVRSIELVEGGTLECLFSSVHVRQYLSENLSESFREHVDEIMDVLQEMGGPDPDAWSSDEGMLHAILDSCGMKDNKTNMKGVRPAVNKVVKCISGGCIMTPSSLEIPSEHAREFADVLEEMHREMITQRSTDFPARPLTPCEGCDYYRICTRDIVVLEDDSDGSE